jgi:hypothetical protein
MTKKRCRLGARNLEALIVLSPNEALLAEVVGIDVDMDVAFLEAQPGLIIRQGARTRPAARWNKKRGVSHAPVGSEVGPSTCGQSVAGRGKCA